MFQVGSTIRGMERKPFPSETQERFIVRLPDGMRDRIAEAAKASGRSMNAEIVARLQASFVPAITSSSVKFSGLEESDEEVRHQVSEFAKKRGMSYRDALMLLVEAGLKPEAPQIIHIRVGAGATMQEVKSIITEAAAIADPSASLIYERDNSAAKSGQR